MLKGWEKETQELSEYELTLVPLFILGFKDKIGKKNQITNKQICDAMKKLGHKLTDVRVRKIVHYLRAKKLVRNLVSSNRGYWIAESQKEVEDFIHSMQQRINSAQETINSFG